MESERNPILSYRCIISKSCALALSTLRQILSFAYYASSSHTSFLSEMQLYNIPLKKH